MNNWFSVKVKYTKQMENGTFKRISELYLIAAISFTEAETRAYEELKEIVKGEFSILAITRIEFHDIFEIEDVDEYFEFYKCKISFEDAIDDNESKGKKVSQLFLVQADSVKNADTMLKEELSTMMVDFKVTSVVKSPIVEIFHYREKLDDERDIENLNDYVLTSDGSLPIRNKTYSEGELILRSEFEERS